MFNCKIGDWLQLISSQRWYEGKVEYIDSTSSSVNIRQKCGNTFVIKWDPPNWKLVDGTILTNIFVIDGNIQEAVSQSSSGSSSSSSTSSSSSSASSTSSTTSSSSSSTTSSSTSSTNSLSKETFNTETAKILTPGSFQEWKSRMDSNPLFTEEMKQSIHTKPILVSEKNVVLKNLSSLQQVNVNIPWSIYDFMSLVYENPAYEFWTSSQEGDANYLGSSEGRIFNLDTQNLLKTTPSKSCLESKDYIKIRLSTKKSKLHNLIMYMLMPKDIKIVLINHINGDRCDNRIINLEPSDDEDNARKARYETGHKGNVPVIRINKLNLDEQPVLYQTIAEAACKNNINRHTLKANLYFRPIRIYTC